MKVILRVVSNNYHGENAASFLNIDTRNKQVTVYDPAASGYATSVAHRKAAMAPKMFAFDGVCSPDDSLVRRQSYLSLPLINHFSLLYHALSNYS